MDRAGAVTAAVNTTVNIPKKLRIRHIPLQNYQDPVYQSCDQDRLRFCKQVQAGKGRTHNCLRDNYNKLSDKCKSKIKLKKIKNKKRQ